MTEELPQGGGSLLVAWQLKGKRVLIIGGGDVSSGRVKAVLGTDAEIILISPQEGLHPQTKFFVENTTRITYHDRIFAGEEDLTNVDMVLAAIDDVENSRQICLLCRERNIPVNVADIPSMCDFYFGSQVRRGPLQILVSTNGNGPKLANIIKARIEGCLPERVGEAIEKVGLLRSKLRERAAGVGGEVGKKRMRWMTSICTTWSLEELALLDEQEMESLLNEGWENNVVPKPNRSSALTLNVSTTLWRLVGFLIAMTVALVGVMLGRRR